MQLHTFKARSLAEAMRLVRDELGPDASVLHTRELGSPLARLLRGRLMEVTASVELQAPSRLPQIPAGHIPAAELQDFRQQIRLGLLASEPAEASLIEQLSIAKNNQTCAAVRTQHQVLSTEYKRPGHK